jgi:hypothetical protein
VVRRKKQTLKLRISDEEGKENDCDMIFVGDGFLQEVGIESCLETFIDVTDACTHKDASTIERKLNLYIQWSSKTVCECASVPIHKQQRQAQT